LLFRPTERPDAYSDTDDLNAAFPKRD
jgi:hypothetical protein